MNEFPCPHCGGSLSVTPAPATGIPAHAKAVINDSVMRDLAAKPGEWVYVKTYRGSSRKVATDIKHPPGVELKCFYRTEDGRRVTHLYAALNPKESTP